MVAPVAVLTTGWLGKLLVGALAAVGTLRISAGLYFWRVADNLERPEYKVLYKLSAASGGKIEIRQYEPYLIAETAVDGVGFREPTKQGFRTCAGYIFGKNKSRRQTKNDAPEKMAMTAPVRISGQTPPPATNEKMAMTAPVRLVGGGGNRRKTKVSFVIGREYSLQTAPKPLDGNVSIRQVPSHVLAVRTFSGPPPSDERVERERAKLEQALASDPNLEVSDDETLVYGYHDPFITPNLLRRNEVAVRVKIAKS